MTDYLKEARDFLKEVIKQFGEGASKGDKVLRGDACEKGWGHVPLYNGSLLRINL
jgi:hypothetical protein